MAVIDHHDLPLSSHDAEERHCAIMFALTWVGFFAAIGLFSYLVSLL